MSNGLGNQSTNNTSENQQSPEHIIDLIRKCLVLSKSPNERVSITPPSRHINTGNLRLGSG